MGTVVGIDASRLRSGGAKAHLIGLLTAQDPTKYGISHVHVWSYRSLLEALPDAPWLHKHNPPELERSLPRQAWWQWHTLPGEVRRKQCDILMSPDAGTIGNYQPSVVMSQDMLSYEPGEMRRFGLSKARVRLLLLRYIQARSLKHATATIFLTRYAAQTIQKFTGPLGRVGIIPHGVGEAFRQDRADRAWPTGPGAEIRCLYVSNAEMYKHQWTVVRAIGELRRRGYNISLTLAGGGTGEAQRLTDEEIRRTDPRNEFVRVIGAVRHEELPPLLAQADLFVFASSCENLPVTLLEAMASGLPIASSNRGPMPEVLADGGVYFDPEDHISVADAVTEIITNDGRRRAIADRASELSSHYSWAKCAGETWTFLRENTAGRQPGMVTETAAKPPFTV